MLVPHRALMNVDVNRLLMADLPVSCISPVAHSCLRRLLVEELAIGAVQLTLDVHVSEASPQRIPVDAHAVPVALPPTAALRLWAWPATLVRGLAAHYLAEALLNAPQVLGSLDLLANPTGAASSTLLCLSSRADGTCCTSKRGQVVYCWLPFVLNDGTSTQDQRDTFCSNILLECQGMLLQAWCGPSQRAWATCSGCPWLRWAGARPRALSPASALAPPRFCATCQVISCCARAASRWSPTMRVRLWLWL